jgi:hypothetical protein
MKTMFPQHVYFIKKLRFIIGNKVDIYKYQLNWIEYGEYKRCEF